MAKINGTTLLVYCDGTLAASQRNVTVTWEQDLPDATDKDSAGWESHINGTRRCSVDFDGLYNDTGLNHEEFIAYITGRASCVLVIDGTGVPIVGEARVRTIALNAEKEMPATYSGSFTFDGPAWMLTGVYAEQITSWSNIDYDTFTTSGTAISSAINASGDASGSASMDVEDASTYKVITFLTLNSGQAPKVELFNSGGSSISNEETLSAGVNIATLISTGAGSGGSIRVQSTAAANFALSKVYVFKV